MPLYEYQCERCGNFELIQKFSDTPLDVCPTCGDAVHKLLSAPAIRFKGTGWYVTDYARKSKASGEGGEGGEGKDAAPKKTDSDTSATPAKTTTQKDAASSSSSSNSSSSSSK